MKRHLNRTHHAADSGGFTLLELIISIALLLSAVVIVSGALRLGQRAIATGDRKVEGLERIRTTALLLDSQIQSALPLTREDDGASQYLFLGDASTLRLATNYSLWGAEKGYVVATWRVERNGTGKASLFLAEQVVGVDGTREARLLEGLDEMTFSFFRKGLTPGENEWVERWDDATELPGKVRILMAAGDRKRVFIVPLRSAGTLSPAARAQTKGGR